MAFERRCIPPGFVALPHRTCQYASVARLAGCGASTLSVLHPIYELNRSAPRAPPRAARRVRERPSRSRRVAAGKQRSVALRERRVEEREHGELPGGSFPVFRTKQAQPQVEVRSHVRRDDAGRLPELFRRLRRPGHPEQGHPETVVRPRVPRPALRRSPERLGRRLVLSLPKEEDAEREEGRRVLRIVEGRLPELPGRLSFPSESKKAIPRLKCARACPGSRRTTSRNVPAASSCRPVS